MHYLLKYALGALLLALGVCLLISVLWGLVWGLTFLTLFLATIVLRDTWKLLSLQRWLQAQPVPAESQPGGTWRQVFQRFHSMKKQTQQTEQKLREALERFQQAGAMLPIGVTVLDINQRIIWCNPSAERHLGIQLKQDRGQSLPYLIRHAAFIAYLQDPPTSTPLIIHRIRGNELSLSLQLVPYSATERMLVTHDISAMERDERIRQDFVANVSHELRTPLTVLSGYIETLLDSDNLDIATQQRALHTMQTQAARMLRLVQELLSLSHLESRRSPAPEEPIPVDYLVQQAVQTGQQLSQGQHTLCGECSVADLLLGSESDLLSAFGNLVTNAVRYTPPGGRIDIQWQRDAQGNGRLSVRDTGPGIAPEHLPRLTERFYRVDRGRSRETGGTGLGLAIVKQVAMHHDSKLDISSVPGKGSCFSLIFPARRIRQQDPAVPLPFAQNEPKAARTHAHP